MNEKELSLGVERAKVCGELVEGLAYAVQELTDFSNLRTSDMIRAFNEPNIKLGYPNRWRSDYYWFDISKYEKRFGWEPKDIDLEELLFEDLSTEEIDILGVKTATVNDARHLDFNGHFLEFLIRNNESSKCSRFRISIENVPADTDKLLELGSRVVREREKIQEGDSDLRLIKGFVMPSEFDEEIDWLNVEILY